MIKIPTGLIKPGVISGLPKIHWALIKIMLMGLMASANPASAAYVYKMAGGECLDSNRVTTLVSPPGAPEVYEAGPKLCANQVSVQVTMRDDYVPGTPFFYQNDPGADPDPGMKIQSFSFSDGARSITTNFTRSSYSQGYVQGALPANGELGDLDVQWLEGFVFAARKNGTWQFDLEFGATTSNRRDFCGAGSTAGPNGICNFTGNYTSLGTYDGWIRVPEPPVIPLLGLSLAVLAGFSHKRRKTAI